MAATRRGGPVRDLAVDLGTASTLAAVRGRGVVLEEPTVAAVDRATGRLLRAGREALDLFRASGGEALTARPVVRGALEDGALGQAILRAVLDRAAPGRVLRPRLLLAVPAEASPVEEGALVEAGLRAGARRVYLMESPLAAALGAGLEAEGPEGHLVVDVGAGVTEIGVLSLGRVLLSARLEAAGADFDAALLRRVRRDHGVLAGRRSAEEVKRTAGGLFPGEEGEVTLRGRCLTTGLPREARLTRGEIAEALTPVAEEIVRGTLEVLERTPPDLAADIAGEGILLTGGGSLLGGLGDLLARETGLPVRRAEDPVRGVILGLEQALPTLSRRKDGVLDLARRRTVSEE